MTQTHGPDIDIDTLLRDLAAAVFAVTADERLRDRVLGVADQLAEDRARQAAARAADQQEFLEETSSLGSDMRDMWRVLGTVAPLLVEVKAALADNAARDERIAAVAAALQGVEALEGRITARLEDYRGDMRQVVEQTLKKQQDLGRRLHKYNNDVQGLLRMELDRMEYQTYVEELIADFTTRLGAVERAVGAPPDDEP